jgi:tRNA threonylcarbamoyl adenosine modification protein YeaZ
MADEPALSPALELGDEMVLAIDTATRSSVVVLGADDARAVSYREVQHRHGSHVLEQVDTVLRDGGSTLSDITAVAVGTGPGSFTGLRVGLATAKTIAYARKLPLVGVMSSDALRPSQPTNTSTSRSTRRSPSESKAETAAACP